MYLLILGSVIAVGYYRSRLTIFFFSPSGSAVGRIVLGFVPSLSVGQAWNITTLLHALVRGHASLQHQFTLLSSFSIRPLSFSFIGTKEFPL